MYMYKVKKKLTRTKEKKRKKKKKKTEQNRKRLKANERCKRIDQYRLDRHTLNTTAQPPRIHAHPLFIYDYYVCVCV